MPRVPQSSLCQQQGSRSLQVGCVVFLLLMGVVLFHRFVPWHCVGRAAPV
jgi:hypothetical protein